MRSLDNEKSESLRGQSRRRIIIIIGSLLAYAFALSRLGYLLSTFLLMGILFSLVEKRNWLVIIVKAIIVTLITYFMFEKWLACQLPPGILWF
jgi:putative tricarboxylic transport membrane protein